jgi:hypothetical protein
VSLNWISQFPSLPLVHGLSTETSGLIDFTIQSQRSIPAVAIAKKDKWRLISSNRDVIGVNLNFMQIMFNGTHTATDERTK